MNKKNNLYKQLMREEKLKNNPILPLQIFTYGCCAGALCIFLIFGVCDNVLTSDSTNNTKEISFEKNKARLNPTNTILYRSTQCNK